MLWPFPGASLKVMWGRYLWPWYLRYTLNTHTLRNASHHRASGSSDMSFSTQKHLDSITFQRNLGIWACWRLEKWASRVEIIKLPNIKGSRSRAATPSPPLSSTSLPQAPSTHPVCLSQWDDQTARASHGRLTVLPGGSPRCSGDAMQLKFWLTATGSTGSSSHKLLTEDELEVVSKSSPTQSPFKISTPPAVGFEPCFEAGEWAWWIPKDRSPQALQSELGYSLSPSWEVWEALHASDNNHMQVLHRQPGENQNPTPRLCITGNVAEWKGGGRTAGAAGLRGCSSLSSRGVKSNFTYTADI